MKCERCGAKRTGKGKSKLCQPCSAIFTGKRSAKKMRDTVNLRQDQAHRFQASGRSTTPLPKQEPSLPRVKWLERDDP